MIKGTKSPPKGLLGQDFKNQMESEDL